MIKVCALVFFGMMNLSVLAAPPKQTPAFLEKGKKSYAQNCIACHGDKGDGLGTTGKMLNPKPRNFIQDKFKNGETTENVFKTVSEGLPGTLMTSYKHLSEEERWGLSYYVLSFRKK